MATVVAHGAASRLLMQSGYPWYDPEKSKDHGMSFNIGIQQATASYKTGFTRATGSVHMRPMA